MGSSRLGRISAVTFRLTDDRLNLLYTGKDFGGETIMRAAVIRELIDEIRALRLEVARSGSQRRHPAS
jgi:hypothetical protein